MRRWADLEEKHVLEDKVTIPKDYLEMPEEELQKKIDEQLVKDGKNRIRFQNTIMDRLEATIQLWAKLEEGEQSAREKGWLTADEVEAALGL